MKLENKQLKEQIILTGSLYNVGHLKYKRVILELKNGRVELLAHPGKRYIYARVEVLRTLTKSPYAGCTLSIERVVKTSHKFNLGRAIKQAIATTGVTIL